MTKYASLCFVNRYENVTFVDYNHTTSVGELYAILLSQLRSFSFLKRRFLHNFMNLSYWLNTTAYTPLELTLAVVGNLSWVLVYILLIRNARQQKFMGMPLFIGAGNLAWEALYSFVFAEYINLGMAIVWGVRAWFFLDCYIFYLSVKTAPNEVSTPLIQRYIMPIGLALFLAWSAFIWAIVSAGLDNVPFGSSSAVKLGGVSAYILNMGISLLFLVQYLRLYTVQSFSKAIAWAKMIGTGVTTIFFALIDPQNLLLLTMGGIVFVADMAYIVLQYVLPSGAGQSSESRAGEKDLQSKRLDTSLLNFPPNPTFDTLWEQNPDYLEFEGYRLRKLQLPHWHYTDATYHRESFVLEGAIICNTDIGDCTGEAAQNCTTLVSGILQELQMDGKPLYFIDNALRVGKANAEARRNANHSFTTVFRGLHLFLVTTDLIRIAFRLTRPFSPETYRNWRLFGSFDDALSGMLRKHFSSSPPPLLVGAEADLSQEEEQSEPEQSALPVSYHEKRIDELYTILAKIAYNDFHDIPMPVVPENDLYADIFKALVIVMDDKRLQMEQVLAQKEQLEEQATQIQLANVELSFQNDSLVALNREKSEIMGIVAHDLKNPIGAIRGLADLLEADFADTPKSREIATQIVRTANRMLDLVKNILDINQLEEGAMSFHPVQIDLVPIVESTIWQYTHAAEQKNITIHFHHTSGDKQHISNAGTTALVDEQAVTQVFDNLLSNAVKYSPHRSEIFVRLKTVGTTIRVEVQDKGEGISSEDMPKLFGKFVRLSAQPTGGEHSTGLGLSIVKRMVEAMQGRVWCESVLGEGATFIVEFPTTQTDSTIIRA